MAKLVTRIQGAVVSTEVAVGSPAACIVAAAIEHGVDLIVMGTHGRGPLMHVMLGNVAERVVRTAPCPVLTVRQPGPSMPWPRRRWLQCRRWPEARRIRRERVRAA